MCTGLGTIGDLTHSLGIWEGIHSDKGADCIRLPSHHSKLDTARPTAEKSRGHAEIALGGLCKNLREDQMEAEL